MHSGNIDPLQILIRQSRRARTDLAARIDEKTS
jgi:hypothetical protein